MAQAILFTEITCPYCFSELTTSIDVSAGDQTYYEDCQICCAPMQLTIVLDEEGELASLEVEPGND